MVRKLPVVAEMQIHSGELPAVCFGGSVWKGNVYSKTRKNSENQTNVIISEHRIGSAQSLLRAHIVPKI